ncbi:phage-like protein [Staphylococcus aureus]|nr:phage-like protein [Staphylococcus aureus]
MKKTFDTAEELEIYIKQHGLEYEEQKQLTFILEEVMKVNYETGFQLGVMEARLKKMRKQRDEYRSNEMSLLVDIAKLRERNEELENKASAWDRHCKSVEKIYKRIRQR